MVGGRAFAIAEDPRELKDLRLSTSQQLFHGEFGGGVEMQGQPRAIGGGQFRAEGMQMGLKPGGDLQGGRLHF